MRPSKQYVAVPGSEREPLPGACVVSWPDPFRLIDVALLVRPPQGEGLASVHELGARPPRERRHLTREEFANIHSADPADIRKVLRFARENRLMPLAVNAAARTVHLRGTVAAFCKAFRVQLLVYGYARGTYRGRTGPVHVPAELDGIVQAVFGLDNRPQARPHFRPSRRLGGAWPHARAISYTPNQVAKLYNFPAEVDGQDQCIGIIELGGGYTCADLNIYFQKLGIPPPKIVPVAVRGGKNHPTGSPSGPDGEVDLDIEVAGAIAPKAQIVVYFAPNTNLGFFRAVTRAIHDRVHKPSVISISWGGPEAAWSAQALNGFNQALQAAGLIGVTVCCAAGDGGSSDGVPGRLAHVDFPASSPHVLACGGTRLESSANMITREVVWNDGPSGGAGGGGVSDFFPLPAWQANAGVPPSVNPGGHVGRGVPDVAGDADPMTGYAVRVDGVDTTVGGTSAVAPLWAALIALFNQKLGVSVGYLNPLLYSRIASAPGALRDITRGNNDMTGRVGGYAAGRGWDACSGFGTPDGTLLLAALQ